MIVSFSIRLKNRRIRDLSFCLRLVESGMNPRLKNWCCRWVATSTGDRTRLILAAKDRFVPDSTHYLLAWMDKERPSNSSVPNRHNKEIIVHSKEHVTEEFTTFILKRGASSRPKKARASLHFCLASRAYGSVGTGEQGSYSDIGWVL